MGTPLPKAIGRYEIVREIGRGAMGVVYEGRDLSLMRPVALKTLSLGSLEEGLREPFEKRFYQEARAAAGLQHPCIVVVYEIGIDAVADCLFITLEYLRGQTLEDLIEKGAIPWRKALHIGARLADALAHAHENGIVHRDIKPGNVMILKKDEPKIMDFGVAKLDSSKLTSKGEVLGSPAYMAPEQALEARVDARSDLFSLGTVLYEALTGRRAFGSGTFSEILMRLAYEHPEAPSRQVADIPAAVDDIVAHALAKNPAERYVSADALAEDIDDALNERPLRHAPNRPGGLAASIPPPRGPGALKAPTANLPPVKGAKETEPTPRLKDRDLPKGPLALPDGKQVSLSFLSGPKAGTEYVLRHASLLIGREGGNAGAAIEVAESQVSRMHATIEVRGTRFVLRDLESKNGTFVGPERVKEMEIEHGTEFIVGNTRFMLLVTDES